MKQKYTVLATGFLYGFYRKRGDVVSLHPKAAETFLAPWGHQLAEGVVDTAKIDEDAAKAAAVEAAKLEKSAKADK